MISEKKVATSFAKRIIRSGLRTFLWILLLACVSFFVLLVLGYLGASKSISYLPEISINESKTDQHTNVKAEIKSSKFIVSVNGDGVVCVKTTEGETIMSGLNYYSSNEGFGEKWGLDRVSADATSDSTILITGEGSSGSLVRIILTVPGNRPNLDVNINTRYSRNTIVRRESLVAGFDVSVSEIYMKNRQADTASFDSEYWLQREGVRFGRGKRSALIYHTPDVSSLQLDTKKRLLLINLEYYSDHPFINIPFQKDGGGRWIDLSDASYKSGDTRNNSFSINFGDCPKAVPRMMLVPKGYLAGYVFTEHADGGNIRTHRAAYFGSEDITSITDATGGFAGYKIPVTKSIFFHNIEAPEKPSNMNDTEQVQVLDFMDQLHATGKYDICLHGANSNRKEVEEWIKFMEARYDAATWIDHGMFSGKENRQSFVCDGLDPASEYYTADLWEKYGTRYFWNASVEELRKLPVKEKIIKLRFYEASLNLWRRNFSSRELHKMGFTRALKELFTRVNQKGELNSFLPGRGNAFPTPLYWEHSTRTRHFYSWSTDYFKTFSHSEQEVKNEEEKLSKLISDWGIFINHGYFVRNLYVDGVFINSGGKITASPYFNQTLAIMARMREKGDLFITTIRDLIDYWVMIENISFDYMPDGTILIKNLNDRAIPGFSLAIRADTVRINGEIPNCRITGDDIVFWFDFTAGQSVRLQTK
jgi:hypothetical protein